MDEERRRIALGTRLVLEIRRDRRRSVRDVVTLVAEPLAEAEIVELVLRGDLRARQAGAWQGDSVALERPARNLRGEEIHLAKSRQDA